MPGWQLRETPEGQLSIRQEWKVKNFEAGLKLFERIGEVAEAEVRSCTPSVRASMKRGHGLFSAIDREVKEGRQWGLGRRRGRGGVGTGERGGGGDGAKADTDLLFRSCELCKFHRVLPS